MIPKALITSDKGATGDERYTPAYAVRPLLPYLPQGWRYYEPTAGKSQSIVEALQSVGLKVKAGNTDFLRAGLHPSMYDCIVTNPPYSIKDQFIGHCFRIGKPFALLLPIPALQGNVRGEMFSAAGVDLSIIVLNQRVAFSGSSPHFGVMWLCYKIPMPQLQFVNIVK